jgi:hypothetical protein
MNDYRVEAHATIRPGRHEGRIDGSPLAARALAGELLALATQAQERTR